MFILQKLRQGGTLIAVIAVLITFLFGCESTHMIEKNCADRYSAQDSRSDEKIALCVAARKEQISQDSGYGLGTILGTILGVIFFLHLQKMLEDNLMSEERT